MKSQVGRKSVEPIHMEIQTCNGDVEKYACIYRNSGLFTLNARCISHVAKVLLLSHDPEGELLISHF